MLQTLLVLHNVHAFEGSDIFANNRVPSYALTSTSCDDDLLHTALYRALLCCASSMMNAQDCMTQLPTIKPGCGMRTDSLRSSLSAVRGLRSQVHAGECSWHRSPGFPRLYLPNCSSVLLSLSSSFYNYSAQLWHSAEMMSYKRLTPMLACAPQRQSSKAESAR